MSRDKILTDEKGARYSYDNIRTQGWLNGHASGLDQVLDFLHERAVKLFRERKDNEAIAMRALADDLHRELRAKMTERADQHEREHPALLPKEKA